METIPGIIILVNTYAIIFYRQMVKFYYLKENDVKESNFGAIFSFLPYNKVSAKGKNYAKKY